jgi:arginyl-tRNA synthetase
MLARLAIVKSVTLILESALKLIAVDAPERM